MTGGLPRRVLVALLRCRGGLAYGSAELVKFAFSIVQLAIDHLQPRNERTHVDTRGLHDPIRYFDGGLLQYAKNTLNIYAANSILLKYPTDGRPAYLGGLGWRRCDEPKLEKPRGGELIGELQHLGIIPP